MPRRLNLLLTATLLLLLATLPAAHAAELKARATLSPDAIEIAYWEGGSGDLSLVFVHGWTCDHSYWSEQLSVFAEDYRVIAVDLAGHGESGLGRASYSMESFGADVSAAIDGDGPLVLVGHSMGGPVILQAALLLGDRVRGLVAVDTLRDVAQPVISDEQMQARVAPLEQDYDSVAGQFLASMFVENSDPDLRREITVDMLATDRFVGVDAIRGMLRTDLAVALEAVAAPLVLINSTYQPTNLAAVVALHPNTSLELMEGVGHFVMMEDPESFNSLLRQAILSFRP
ncbi:MAG: pimeloyl-ACP methyl ester carboxylesterase [Halieaceae bacterium]|jgi:pimeloyl-ACP methyl ester carboxylesterase